MALELLDDSKTIEVTDAEIVDGGDKDTTYTIRKITQARQREFRKRNTRPGNYRRDEAINHDGLQDDQIDYALVAWSGVVANGQPVPCERSYKLRLDIVRKVAILDRACIADVVAAEEAKDKSFRGPA